jgi:uncharacterized membrane protein YphA (DoxX/SURF4 family)
MAVDTFRSWDARTIVIARAFLATTLLLRTSDGVSHVTFFADLVFLFELLLGAAIAVGWLMRYAAAMVLLGTIAAAALAPHSHLALFPANPGTTAAVLITSGILVCFGQNTDKVDAARIDENNESSSEPLCVIHHEPWDEGLEVTIRLEYGHGRGLQRHLDIVTIHDRAGGVRNTGEEVWYARDDG